ncbi:MAG TPA: hypothetical protein PK055_00320 [Gammaproteobacteria bacterium]|nr:hypothetical protein [Xanthomonadales bacterium]MCB1594623.1 hypothetical protein [Xanthomonadales bacterium]HOP21458.1 hypothetical protein [Gammaproteobacteria bacterium]HPI94632.1 hypothetical protein [Gammaproteobacteria bacterium]HPQ86077.1 hypothetical protein [Gammaproteobacteria bacterium]
MDRIVKAVEKILSDRRRFEKSCGFITADKRNVIKDYKHLMDVVDSTLRATPITESLINFGCVKSTNLAQHIILKISVAFNMRYYSSLGEALKNKNLFPWEPQANKERDIFILLLWKQNIFSLVSALLLSNQFCEYQAKHLIRGYIESFALIYLSLIDVSFADKLTSTRIPEEEYMKLWFKELKPSKVKSKIDKIHKHWRLQDEKAGRKYLGSIRNIQSSLITGGYVESIYKMTSDYIHFKKSAVFRESLANNADSLCFGLSQVGEKTKHELLLITSKIYPMLSSLISSLMFSHVMHIESNEIMWDLLDLNSSLYLEFWNK